MHLESSTIWSCPYDTPLSCLSLEDQNSSSIAILELLGFQNALIITPL